MKRFDMRVVFGLLLVCLGGLFLLQNFDVIPADMPLLWVAVFALSGVVFLYAFITDTQQWWFLIPAFALLGLAALIGLPSLLPEFPDAAGAAGEPGIRESRCRVAWQRDRQHARFSAKALFRGPRRSQDRSDGRFRGFEQVNQAGTCHRGKSI